MSIFPFTSDAITVPQKEPLPILRELAYDFEHNCLLRQGGKTYLVEKDEALKIWIYKALKTKRFVWPAYTHAFGNELDKLKGINNTSLLDSEAKRYITEALMASPYIQELINFTFVQEGCQLIVNFEVVSIYGRFTYESEVYNE